MAGSPLFRIYEDMDTPNAPFIAPSKKTLDRKEGFENAGTMNELLEGLTRTIIPNKLINMRLKRQKKGPLHTIRYRKTELSKVVFIVRDSVLWNSSR